MSLRLALSAALLAGVALVGPAQAAPVPVGATWTEQWITSPDGTPLHADVLLPTRRDEREKHPVILSVGPYFGSGTQSAGYSANSAGPSARFRDLIEGGRIFQKGYALVLVDSRGYGSSGGCHDLGGSGEQADAKAAVEWAASQSWSTGKVGMWGKSYDAWTQVMAMATKAKGLAATVIQSPLIETYRGFYDNGVHLDAGFFATPTLYAQTDLTPPSLTGTPDEFANAVTGPPTNPDCYAMNQAGPLNADHSAAYWKERDLVAAASSSTVPSLWSFGFNDANTRPTNIFDVYGKLRGPKRAWFGQWDHVRGNEADQVGRDGFLAEAMNWFDHHLKGLPLKRLPQHEIQDGDGDWRSEAAYPPADAVGRGMPVKAGSYVDQPGSSATSPRLGTWTVSQPAPHDVRLAGLPRLTVEATTSAPVGGNLVALLYDVAPDGGSRLITRGAYRLPASGTTSFDMWPADWRLPQGHRLALHVAGDDVTAFSPAYTGSTVTLAGGSLRLPLLTRARVADLAGDAARAQSQVPRPQLAAADLAGRDVRADFGRPARR